MKCSQLAGRFFCSRCDWISFFSGSATCLACTCLLHKNRQWSTWSSLRSWLNLFFWTLRHPEFVWGCRRFASKGPIQCFLSRAILVLLVVRTCADTFLLGFTWFYRTWHTWYVLISPCRSWGQALKAWRLGWINWNSLHPRFHNHAQLHTALTCRKVCRHWNINQKKQFAGQRDHHNTFFGFLRQLCWTLLAKCP